jgi:hypothetical protein
VKGPPIVRALAKYGLAISHALAVIYVLYAWYTYSGLGHVLVPFRQSGKGLAALPGCQGAPRFEAHSGLALAHA